jgi:hypothetical protein
MMAVRVLTFAATALLLASADAFAIPARIAEGRIGRELAAKLVGANSTVNFFTQVLNHSNPDAGTFQQRWWVDYSQFNASTGPVILYISGEGPASSSPGGSVATYGAALDAVMVTLEHRF